MRKTNLLIALLFCLTISAQFDNNFGIKAGANYSQFSSDSDMFKGKIGYYVGGYFNLGLSDKISFRPELLLANQGTKISFETMDPQDFDLTIVEENLNDLLILIPVTFRYELVERLFLELGPQVGYLVKRTIVYKKIPDPSLEGERSKSSLSHIDQFDFGLNCGLGFDLTDRLELNARYSLGLIELDDFHKTSVISLGLGFKI